MSAARVLIADADEQVRRALARALVKVPSRRVLLQDVATSDDALRALVAHRYDVVIAGAQLGTASGAELLARVARSQPKAARVLVASHGEAPTGAPTMARSLVQLIVWKPVVESEATRLFDGLVAAPSDQPTHGGEPVKRRPAAALRAELRRIDTEMRRLRVQLALGTVSASAHARLWEELAQRKAKVEQEEREAARTTSAQS